jgi:hypothetical protein
VKKTALLIAALMLGTGAGLAGCASGTTTIDGTYRLTTVEEGGEAASAEESGLSGASLTFTSEDGGKSGTVLISMGGEEDQEATFTKDGAKLTLTSPESEETLECSLEGEQLTCSDQTTTMTLTKAAAG